jgi:hypothetical protein
MTTLRLAGALLLLGSTARAEVVVTKDGDHLSGQITVRGSKRLRLQTPYGLLVIPLEKIERIRKDDGTEEVLNAPRAAPTHALPPPTVPLVLDLGGNTFWQAWDPKNPPADPSLSFVVRVDDKVMATFVDSTLDPNDLPKTVVNTFAFNPETLKLRPAPGVRVQPPEVKGGRIRLVLELPAGWDGTRRIQVAYQANDGTESEPRWHDLASGEAITELRIGESPPLKIEQARGTMEFTKKQMHNVDSFHVALHTTE